jgi:hypothetical protein
MRHLVAPLLVAVASSLPGTAAAATVTDVAQTVPAARFAVPETAQAARAWRTTPPLRAPRRFTLLGVRASETRTVDLRVRLPDGGWSRWVAAPAGEPVWSGPARVYQLRAQGPPRAVRMHVVSVAPGHGRRPAKASAAAGIRPPIVPRSAWDPHGACRPRVTPAYGRVDFAVVHHTVSLNAYAPRDVPGILLGICRFHRNGNDWNDIGYNLLVDRFGTVWEGRGGGVEQPVAGAHAQGWNDVSTGVAAIGDFGGGAGLPDGALRALARVLAWKLSLAGAPASGTVGEASIGGDQNRWRAGAHVRFARVAVHRDGGLTDCPGSGLVAQLPALRALTARLLPAPRELLTISPAPAPQRAGGPVLLTGRLARGDGRRPAGAPIALQRRDAGTWVDVAGATTGPDGIWSAALPLTENAELRAIHAPSGIASPAIAVPVRAGVGVRVARRQVRLGGTVELTGRSAPAKARVRVVVDRRVADRRFRRVRVHVVTTVTGRFALALRLPAVGDYRVRATTAADRTNAAGMSRSLAVQVLTARR